MTSLVSCLEIFQWQKLKVECFINRRSDFGTPLARVPVQILVLSQPEQLYVQCILCTNISTVTFILLPDHVLGLLGELPGDLILHLMYLPIHHLVTLVIHLATQVGHLATLVD